MEKKSGNHFDQQIMFQWIEDIANPGTRSVYYIIICKYPHLTTGNSVILSFVHP